MAHSCDMSERETGEAHMMRSAIAAVSLLLTGCAADSVLSAAPPAMAQAQTVAAIRALEERERLAVLTGDVAAIERFWDPLFLVNAPNNRLLVGSNATLDLVRARVISFERFERNVERVEVDGDVAVTMGSETIVQKAGPQAGQVIQRRYTNVWLHRGGEWRLRFRHANVVPPQPQILEPRR